MDLPQGAQPSPGRTALRRAILSACVAGMFAAEFLSIDPGDVAFRARATFRPHALERDRVEGTDFLFDRSYGFFLEQVAASTPPGASIRLCAPAGNELYDFAAAYLLAPRAVARSVPGDYTAAYACPEKLPPGRPLGKGTLVRR